MNHDFHSGRILLVDDDESSLELLAEILTSVGNEVETAVDGRDALTKIEQFSPEVVLLDLQMPGRDGFELARLMRVNPRLASISIVMISGLSDPAARQRAIQCGADDFMTKPLKSEDLILRVASAVRLWRMRKDMASLKAKVTALEEKEKSRELSGNCAPEGLQNILEKANRELRHSLMGWAGFEVPNDETAGRASASLFEKDSIHQTGSAHDHQRSHGSGLLS